MKGIFSRDNAPYVVAGSLATLVLLTSGVFAAAPYIAFLASVAALDFGLLFIIDYAVLSSIIIDLSYVAASKNNVIVDQTVEIEAKNKELTHKTAEIKTQAKDILTNPNSTIL
ncbi:MAG: hypothetical protein PG981_000590 [Wolbachia endosymbiont of Ctenocephalides orientis wCori]|nr:MAG: hypothetical protein PG981_000590 [Wolbachia endosymbiont of Ctenocephalides orientis wCori]